MVSATIDWQPLGDQKPMERSSFGCATCAASRNNRQSADQVAFCCELQVMVWFLRNREEPLKSKRDDGDRGKR